MNCPRTEKVPSLALAETSNSKGIFQADDEHKIRLANEDAANVVRTEMIVATTKHTAIARLGWNAAAKSPIAMKSAEKGLPPPSRVSVCSCSGSHIGYLLVGHAAFTRFAWRKDLQKPASSSRTYMNSARSAMKTACLESWHRERGEEQRSDELVRYSCA